MSHEGALNSRAGTDAQADEGLSSVFRVSVKTTYILHSLTQGVLFFPQDFLPTENQRFFFFSQSEYQSIFFRTKQKQNIFFFLNSIYVRNVFFQIYTFVYILNPIYMGICTWVYCLYVRFGSEDVGSILKLFLISVV